MVIDSKCGTEDSSVLVLLVTFGTIENPTEEELERLLEFRGMAHETLGRMVHTILRKYLEQHASKEQLAKIDTARGKILKSIVVRGRDRGPSAK